MEHTTDHKCVLLTVRFFLILSRFATFTLSLLQPVEFKFSLTFVQNKLDWEKNEIKKVFEIELILPFW